MYKIVTHLHVPKPSISYVRNIRYTKIRCKYVNIWYEEYTSKKCEMTRFAGIDLDIVLGIQLQF